MTSPPFAVKNSTKEAVSQGAREFTTVKGRWTPKGLIYKGKDVLPGIFVYVGKADEEEKEKLFDLARKEIGKEAEDLLLYEILIPERKEITEEEKDSILAT